MFSCEVFELPEDLVVEVASASIFSNRISMFSCEVFELPDDRVVVVASVSLFTNHVWCYHVI